MILTINRGKSGVFKIIGIAVIVGLLLAAVHNIGLSQPPENPDSVRAVTIGSKFDEWGRDFQFFYRDDTVFYAYLDFDENKLIEGVLSDDWDPKVIRERDLGETPSNGLVSFLAYGDRKDTHDILYHMKEGTFLWSHKNEDWKEITTLQGSEGSEWHAVPVSDQLPWTGLAYVGLWEFGKEGVSYFKADFRNESIEKVFNESRRWAAIGTWEDEIAVASWESYTPPGQRAATSKWYLNRFDYETGHVEDQIAPPFVSPTRHAQIISKAVPPTVLIGSIPTPGVTAYRLFEDIWKARRIENDGLVRRWLGQQGDEGSSVVGYGGFLVEEAENRIYVLYNSEMGTFLQIWDEKMTAFSEYWMGDFALGTLNGVKFVPVSPEKLITLSNENPRADEETDSVIVDLVAREWNVANLNEVRSGNFEELEVVKVRALDSADVVDDGDSFEWDIPFGAIEEQGLEGYLESVSVDEHIPDEQEEISQMSNIEYLIEGSYVAARGIDEKDARNAAISQESDVFSYVVERFDSAVDWLEANDGLDEDGRVKVEKLVEFFNTFEYMDR